MPKKNKGQMSLEMIIGLVILLVVAGVVISMLLHFLNPESMPNIEEELQERGFTAKCNELCDNKELVEYCRFYFGKGEPGRIDLDRNGMENDLLEVGKMQKWPACESRVYCFLHTTCKRLGGTEREVMQKCAELLCNIYLDKYENNVEYANEAVLKDVEVSSDEMECDFLEILERENWYKKYFPDNICGTGGGNGGDTITLSGCALNKATNPWSFTCSTNCKTPTTISVTDGTTSSSQLSPSIAGGILSSTPSMPVALDSLTCPSTWTVLLTCENPEGNPTSAMVCN